MTIVDLDGTTGQPIWQMAAAGIQQGTGVLYCYPDSLKWLEPQIAIRQDGARVIAAMTNNGLPALTVNGSSIPIPVSTDTDSSGTQFSEFSPMSPPIVNSDNSIYVEYEVRQIAYPPKVTSAILYLLKIDPTNVRTTITLSSTTQDTNLLPGRIIPDGLGGVLATWTVSPSSGPIPSHPYQASHVVSGAPGTPYDLPFTPASITFGQYPTLVLGEDGTPFATDGTDTTNGPQIVSFNLNSGAVSWSYRASTQSTLSLMAVTSEGGIAINDSQQGISLLDASGALTQITTGSLGGSVGYSWGGNWYLRAGQGVSQLALPFGPNPAAIWGTNNGNPSGTAATEALCDCLVQTSAGLAVAPSANAPTAQSQPLVRSEVTSVVQPTSVPSCPICDLPAPTPGGPNQAPSCTTFSGSGPTYVLLVGDPGSGIHNAGQNFNITAQTAANDLQSQGQNVVACRVSSVQNVVTALTTKGLIGGGVIYYGHGGPYRVLNANNQEIGRVSQLAPGQAVGPDTNISFQNVSQLAAVLTAQNGSNIIGLNASILINGCSAGVKLYDYYALFATSIAQQIANKTQRGVYAYTQGMYFSTSDAAHATSSNYTGEPNPLPASLPLYLVPNGHPGRKPSPNAFTPQ
jgi:hypothetical protein